MAQDDQNKGPPPDIKAVFYQGDKPLAVPVESFLHAMDAIISTGHAQAFLQRCAADLTEGKDILVTSPELANLIKRFMEDNKLYQYSTAAMEIMTSPPHKRCWPHENEM